MMHELQISKINAIQLNFLLVYAKKTEVHANLYLRTQTQLT